MIIPDAQLQRGVPVDHIEWAAKAIVDYKPDVLVQLGDWRNMGSLSSYDKPGSKWTEGLRIKDDIEIGTEQGEILMAHVRKERKRLAKGKRGLWNLQAEWLDGNHENRVARAVANEPKFDGMLDMSMLVCPEEFTRHEFLEMVYIDGIAYSHYFANSHSGKAIGGTIPNRLNKIGTSFVQGHQQGLLYGLQQYPGNIVKHGLVAGSFYLHEEHYRDVQSNGEWRGLVVLNEVNAGNYDIMPLSMNYLRGRYGNGQ